MIQMVLQFLIKTYQTMLSPFLPRACRFYPSCSQFALLSLTQSPLHKALLKILYRLSRCHPFCEGGIDFPHQG